ncbi:MAG: glycosyltransferase [Pedobacter sp.]|nr:MAG: glycosyltransferase [Pedobacter sp.]
MIDGVDAYRNYLEDLVITFDLSYNVRFINQYLDTDELLEYLKATDIYMFTSKDPNQAVSGTFSYALSCSCPIVASKIPHTMEILSDDVGVLVDIQQPKQFADAAIALLQDNNRLEQMGVNAYAKSTPNFWENCAVKQMRFYEQIVPSLSECKLKLPPFKWDHLKKLTNEAGLLQFSNISEPHLASGLTLDDNARALIAMSLHYKAFSDDEVFPYLLLYLEFITKCQLEDGSFLNYFTEHNQIDPRNFEENLEDANGRAIWALGTLISIADSKTESFAAQATRSLFKALPSLYKLKSPRAIAFCIKGLHAAYHADDDPRLLDLIGYLGEHLARIYEENATENWSWFENKMTYANAILPEAVLLTYDLYPEKRYRDIAVESMQFLSDKMFVNGKFKVISNKGWYEKGTIPQEYGEQPIDVCYMMVALDNFYQLLDDEVYKIQLQQAFEWYLGRNHLNHIMYNPLTGSCFDGLEKYNVNLNQGAESSVCYLISWLVALQYFQQEKKTIPLYYSSLQKALSYLL